jgi:hypothetical protein
VVGGLFHKRGLEFKRCTPGADIAMHVAVVRVEVRVVAAEL